VYQIIAVAKTPLIAQIDVMGGFTVLDTETGLTSYAYPSSTYAVQARKYPGRVAKAMIKGELVVYRLDPAIEERDRMRERQIRDAAGLPQIDRPRRFDHV
jgi:hypothetical protein